MVLVVTAFSSIMVAVGLYGLVSPTGAKVFALRWRSQAGFWMASGLRLVVGVALWFAAPWSRAPFVLQVLAVVTSASGIALPLMGLSRYRSLLSWWSDRSVLFVRAWCLVAAALGLFVLWAVLA